VTLDRFRAGVHRCNLPALLMRDTSGLFRGVVAMVVVVVAVVGWVARAQGVDLEAPASVAGTHAPCTGHVATKPHINVVVGLRVQLEGGGYIGGCPLVTTAKAESVTMTVCLQRLKAAGFTSVVCKTRSRSWNRYTRFTRSLLFSVYANCVAGNRRSRRRRSGADRVELRGRSLPRIGRVSLRRARRGVSVPASGSLASRWGRSHLLLRVRVRALKKSGQPCRGLWAWHLQSTRGRWHGSPQIAGAQQV
jgi:hypothetical protein